jgi:hypothetical protein
LFSLLTVSFLEAMVHLTEWRNYSVWLTFTGWRLGLAPGLFGGSGE